MLLMRANPLRGQVGGGLGPGSRDFCGALWNDIEPQGYVAYGGPVPQPYAGVNFIPSARDYEFGYSTLQSPWLEPPPPPPLPICSIQYALALWYITKYRVQSCVWRLPKYWIDLYNNLSMWYMI